MTVALARILPDMRQAMVEGVAQAGMITEAQMQAEIAKLRAENAGLKAKAGQSVVQGITFRVTVPHAKPDGTMTKGGAISAYGLGRFPVTLYRGQWERLLDVAQELRAFIEANQAGLSSKD